MRELDVVLCGYYGFGNLGDELLAKALVELLCLSGVDRDRIGVLSASPDQTAGELGVRSEDRWSPRSVFRFLSSSRTLLLGGGGLFQDVTSLKSPLYYWGVTFMARRAGAVPWAFGQSLGPLSSSLGRRLATRSLGACKVRVLRDAPSVKLAQSMGIGAVMMAPDPVLALRPNVGERTGAFIGVNVRPTRSVSLKKVAYCIRDLVLKEGLPVVGLALAEEDLLALRDLETFGVRMEDVRLMRSLRDFEAVAGSLRGTVSMRLHGVVLSVASRIPCVAIPYDPKVEAFAGQFLVPMSSGDRPMEFGDPVDVSALDGAQGALREAMGLAVSKLGIGGGS
jgi:polysaccharide pyruvyl transferase CsaB